MVSRHYNVVTVKAVDDEPDEVAKFVDRLPHGIEGVSFRRCFLASAVDLIVVDVDDLLAINDVPPLLLLHLQQVIGPQNDPVHRGEDLIALFGGRTGLPIDQHVPLMNGSRLSPG